MRLRLAGATQPDYARPGHEVGNDSVEPTEIAIALAATAAVTALVVIWLLESGTRWRHPARAGVTAAPAPFSPPMAWFAIRSEDTRRVLDVLQLEAIEEAGWQAGCKAIEKESERIFVSPPLEGWTLVAGLSLPHPVGPRFVDKCLPLLDALGSEFAEVQYFCCFPAIDHYGWARSIEGKLVRAFALGDEGLIWNRGRPTRDERLLGLKLFEIREHASPGSEAALGSLFDAGEGHVLRLAGKWGIDPTALAIRKSGSSGAGFIGTAPTAWRMERASAPRRRLAAEGAQA